MLHKQGRYLLLRDGVYYFNRRVPEDLKSSYKGDRIVLSLRTGSFKMAHARANELAASMDRGWLERRWLSSCSDEVLDRFRRSSNQSPKGHHTLPTPCPTLEEARSSYVTLTGKGRPDTFFRGTERAVEYLVGVCGSKPVNAYTRTDANALRDQLLQRGLKVSSIKRTIGTLQAIIGFALSRAWD